MPKTATWILIIAENNYTQFEEVPFKSLNSASRHIPGEVYTTFRAYEGNKILPLDLHFRRLEQSAGLVGFSVSLNQPAIINALHTAIRSFPHGENRIRLTVDLEESQGAVFITISTRSILPVRQIDLTLISCGDPGPVTSLLVNAYWQKIKQRPVEV